MSFQTLKCATSRAKEYDSGEAEQSIPHAQSSDHPSNLSDTEILSLIPGPLTTPHALTSVSTVKFEVWAN